MPRAPVIKSCKSKQDRQYNDQKKKDKTKDPANRTTFKSEVNLCAPGGLAVPAPDGVQAMVRRSRSPKTR